jgi:DNA (cytosine-5)-methyltransferase 1
MEGRTETEPKLLGMDDGLGNWMDRIKAIGNGQVPAVVRAAWHLLSGMDRKEE